LSEIGGFDKQWTILTISVAALAVKHDLLNEPLSVKELFLSLPWSVSESGLRKVLRRLETEGMLKWKRCEHDQRLRLIKPTEELVRMISNISRRS
jgi:hypothetical protein